MLTKIDTSNTPLSEFEIQMKLIKQQYDEARYYYNQRKVRIASCLDSWIRNRVGQGELRNLHKLEKILRERLNIGTSMNVIFEQIDKFYEEM